MIVSRRDLVANRQRATGEGEVDAATRLEGLLRPRTIALAELLWRDGFCHPADAMDTAMELWTSTDG